MHCLICWESVKQLQKKKRSSSATDVETFPFIFERLCSILKYKQSDKFLSCNLNFGCKDQLTFCSRCVKGIQQLINLQKKLDKIQIEIDDGILEIKTQLREVKRKIPKADDTLRGFINHVLKDQCDEPSKIETLQNHPQQQQSQFYNSASFGHNGFSEIPSTVSSPSFAHVPGVETETTFNQNHNDIPPVNVVEDFGNVDLIEVQVGFEESSASADDNSNSAEAEEDENADEDENSGEMVDDSNDMDYEPSADYVSNALNKRKNSTRSRANKASKGSRAKVTKASKSSSLRKRYAKISAQAQRIKSHSRRTTNKFNAQPVSETAKEKEYFSPLETTEDGRMFYDGIEIGEQSEGYICGACGYDKFKGVSSITLRKMKIHIKGVHLDAYNCKTCGRKFSSNDILNQHMKRVHESPYIPCEICQKPIKGRCHNMVGHMWTHKNAEEKAEAYASGTVPACILSQKREHSHQCYTCGKIFKKSARLKMHMETHKEPDSRQKFKCSYPSCDKVFSQKLNLTQHIKTKHERQKLSCRHLCLTCGKEFDVKQYLTDHIISKHTPLDVLNIVCSICNRKFKRDSQLQNHMEKTSHHPAEDYKHSCPICERKFVTRMQMNWHKNSKHPQKKIAPVRIHITVNKTVKDDDCDSANETDCDFTDKSSGNIICNKDGSSKKTVRKKTEKFVPFTNGDDGKLYFETYEVLKMKDEGFKCVSCGAEFKHLKNRKAQAERFVKEHIRGVHLGQYTCSFCDKKFRCYKGLSTHKYSVHYIRNRECNICGASVEQKNLRIHSWLHKNADEMAECINAGERLPSAIRMMKRTLGHIVYPEATFKCNECAESFHSVVDLDTHRTEQHLEKVQELYRPKRKLTEDQEEESQRSSSFKTSKMPRRCKNRKFTKVQDDSDDSNETDEEALEHSEDEISNSSSEDAEEFGSRQKGRNQNSLENINHSSRKCQIDTKKSNAVVIITPLPSCLLRIKNVKVISDELVSYVNPRGKTKLMPLGIEEDTKYFTDSDAFSD